MTYLDKFLLNLCKLIKVSHAPRIVKYGLYLIIRKRKIRTKAFLEKGLNIDLHLENISEFKLFMNILEDDLWINLAKDLTENKVFIDVGANIGIYSLILSKHAKRVFAFEPEEVNYKRLLKNIKNGKIQNIKPIQKAVYSNSFGKKNLYINDKDAGWHSLLLKTDTTQPVSTITLDAFVKKNKLDQIGFIKIDVEGAELEVLRSSKNTLKKCPPLLIEFNRPRFIKSGFYPIDVFRMINKNNYYAYTMNKDNNLINLEESEVSSIYNENVLFLSKEQSTSFNNKLL